MAAGYQRTVSTAPASAPRSLNDLDIHSPHQSLRSHLAMDNLQVVWDEVDRLVADADLTDLVVSIQALGPHETLRWFDEWWEAERNADKQRRVMLLVVYGGTQIPDRHEETEKWVARFRQVGFLSDLPGTQPPAAELTVFRGAPQGWELGMSWTTSERTARAFAKRFTCYGPAPGFVWRATVTPEAVLALIFQRDESEVVVDPTGLTVLDNA